jgi:hypothetical protein
LSESAIDLRTFLDVANLAGETIYHSNLKPLAAHHPSTAWKPGEIVRERTVVVLPVSLPKAKYRISIGWLDQARAERLAVVESNVRNEQGCAQVGEIEIRRTPKYGWFSPD